MINKPLTKINAADLQRIVQERWPEGRQLEFKSYHKGMPHRDKVLKAILAFANTAGGDLLIGVSEVEGLAKELTPIPTDQVDTEKLKIEDWISTGIEPPISTHQLLEVPVLGGHVLIARVERSWAGPHRNQHNRMFYGRNSAQSYELPMDALRRAYTEGATIKEGIEQFRDERVRMFIGGGPAYPTFTRQPVVFLHLMPVGSIVGDLEVNVEEAYDRLLHSLTRSNNPLNSRQFNLDGAIGLRVDDEGECSAYAQVFRTGFIEFAGKLPS